MKYEELKRVLLGKAKKEYCDSFAEIANEALINQEYYDYFDLYLELIRKKESHLKSRGIVMVCNVSKFDEKKLIEQNLTDILSVLDDQLPITVRLSLKALETLMANKPELGPILLDKLAKMDLTKYKDSMVPLIKQDRFLLAKQINDDYSILGFFCPCKNMKCDRHGKCNECINHHREKNRLPACMRGKN